MARRRQKKYIIWGIITQGFQFVDVKWRLRYLQIYIDPWKWASLLKSKDQIISRVANCSNCAHCVDLYTPSTNDAPELKKIRD